MNKMKNTFKIAAASALCSCLLIATGCSSNFFDSSVGPDGKKIALNDRGNVKQKTSSRTSGTKNSAKPAASYQSNVQTGQVKPYVPDISDTQGVVNAALAAGVTRNEIKTPMAYNADRQPEPFASEKETLESTNQHVSAGAEVINESVEQSVQSLDKPDYSKCQGLENAQELAYKLAMAQAPRLKSEIGPIYIARTIVPDSYSSCISDLSGTIDQAFSNSGIQTVEGAGVSASVQNTGSAAMIPSLIKACKQTGIPLLNVSVIRTIGVKTVITIRNIRVKDGITLAQNTTQL